MGKSHSIILGLLVVLLLLELARPRRETYNPPPRPTVCNFERNMSRQPNQAILVCK